jgi:hypothetical protein
MAVAAFTVYKPGTYIQNGTSLYFIVKECGNQLLLEDCAHPKMPLMELSARELRDAKWEVVKHREAR